jgi:hypothetical protein
MSMSVGWACGRAHLGGARCARGRVGWDEMEGEGSGMGGWESGEGVGWGLRDSGTIYIDAGLPNLPLLAGG